MTTNELEKLLAEVPKLTIADRMQLQEALNRCQGKTGSTHPMTEVEFADYLASIGVITRSRRRGHKPFPNFQPIQVSGRPLSEDILEDRGPR